MPNFNFVSQHLNTLNNIVYTAYRMVVLSADRKNRVVVEKIVCEETKEEKICFLEEVWNDEQKIIDLFSTN